MRLLGLSDSNANAERRAIVLHARDYMEEDFVRRHGVAGRGYSCPVLADADRDLAITTLRGAALIFVVDSRLTSHDYLNRRQ
ncbi:murein L,D-transpeptidase catalytic domain family protein [Pseudomonas sp. PDM16]|nr:murein L,D-transpeptidase catalytic domain family protein [Pseudomonas sp. PDM16]